MTRRAVRTVVVAASAALAVALVGYFAVAPQDAGSHPKGLTVSATAVVVGNAPLTVSAVPAEPAEPSGVSHRWMRVPLVYRNQADRPLFITIFGGASTGYWGSAAHPLLRTDSDACAFSARNPGALSSCPHTSLGAELPPHGSFTDTITLVRDAPGMAKLRVGTYSATYRISWSESGAADVQVAYDVRDLGRSSKRGLATPPASPSATISVDLDGDGKRDRFVIDEARKQLYVRLGRGLTLRAPWSGGPGARIAATPDIAGDGRHQVLVQTPDNERFATRGVIVIVHDDELVIDDMRDFGYLGWGGLGPGQTVDVSCARVAGRPALVMTRATTNLKGQPYGDVTPRQLADLPHDRLERRWTRQIVQLDGTSFATGPSGDSGTIALDGPSPPGVPLNNRLDCGGARSR